MRFFNVFIVLVFCSFMTNCAPPPNGQAPITIGDDDADVGHSLDDIGDGNNTPAPGQSNESNSPSQPDIDPDCDYPLSQGASEPCCLKHGVDACGANLFCAAFDGRTQPTCYVERQRAEGQECFDDIHCTTGYCRSNKCVRASDIENLCQEVVACYLNCLNESHLSYSTCVSICEEKAFQAPPETLEKVRAVMSCSFDSCSDTSNIEQCTKRNCANEIEACEADE